MDSRLYCAICDKTISPGEPTEPWNRSPWGDGTDWAHCECTDDWEPDDEQLSPREWGPTIQERQVAAMKLKR